MNIWGLDSLEIESGFEGGGVYIYIGLGNGLRGFDFGFCILYFTFDNILLLHSCALLVVVDIYSVNCLN